MTHIGSLKMSFVLTIFSAPGHVRWWQQPWHSGPWWCSELQWCRNKLEQIPVGQPKQMPVQAQLQRRAGAQWGVSKLESIRRAWKKRNQDNFVVLLDNWYEWTQYWQNSFFGQIRTLQKCQNLVFGKNQFWNTLDCSSPADPVLATTAATFGFQQPQQNHLQSSEFYKVVRIYFCFKIHFETP